MTPRHAARAPVDGVSLFVVVTPVYNGAQFIEGALRAVQAQTYRPLVHVVLDNASDDATPNIIARYTHAPVPLIVARNQKTLPFCQNWNAALRLIPEEAAFFKILCADDSMTADAVTRMMELARRAPDLVAIGGMERVNGRLRPSRLPREASIFSATNMLARLLQDDARMAYSHVAYNAKSARSVTDFFADGLVHIDVDALLRVLAQGGRCGFVHAPIFDTLHHDGSVTNTVADMSILWETLLAVERYGPSAFTNEQYARVRRAHLYVLYRRLLWWAVARRRSFTRDFQRLRDRGLAPGFSEYARAVLAWPTHLWRTRLSADRKPRPWPDDAVHLVEQ